MNKIKESFQYDQTAIDMFLNQSIQKLVIKSDPPRHSFNGFRRNDFCVVLEFEVHNIYFRFGLN